MELMLLVWFAGAVERLNGLVDLTWVLTCIVFIMSFIIYAVRHITFDRFDRIDNDPEADLKTPVKELNSLFTRIIHRSAIMLALCSVVLIIMPKDAKTVYMMAGAYVAQQAVMSDTGKKVVEVINLQLDGLIRDAKQGLEAGVVKAAKP